MTISAIQSVLNVAIIAQVVYFCQLCVIIARLDTHFKVIIHVYHNVLQEIMNTMILIVWRLVLLGKKILISSVLPLVSLAIEQIAYLVYRLSLWSTDHVSITVLQLLTTEIVLKVNGNSKQFVWISAPMELFQWMTPILVYVNPHAVSAITIF